MPEAPSVPLLVATVLLLCCGVVRRARTRGVLDASEARACFGLLAGLTGWVALSSVLAASGAYLDPVALRFLPLLVGFLVPVLGVAASVSGLASLRGAVSKLVAWLPLRGLIAVHALRIAALGSIFEYLAGKLPGHFILPVGVPDFLIGLSAVPMAVWAAARAASLRRLLVAWNLAGSAIFLYAGLALHFSLPTPLQLFTSGPTTEAIFRFPLALVPTFLVPFFVASHAAALWKLRSPLA